MKLSPAGQKKLIDSAREKGLKVREDRAVTFLLTGKTLRSKGVALWDDGSMTRTGIDLATAKGLTLKEAKEILNLK